MLKSLSPSDRHAFLQAAETAVRQEVGGKKGGEWPDLPELDISGLFVTLHVSGALRGCIGFLEMQGSLEQTLKEAALRAATSDFRFPPIDRSELDDLEIDVTLLGPLELLSDPLNFTIGTHGLVLEYTGRRGLLLPQVAVEHHWNREQFLDGLCRKTQVSPDSWKLPGARVFRFEGTVIKEAG